MESVEGLESVIGGSLIPGNDWDNLIWLQTDLEVGELGMRTRLESSREQVDRSE